MDRVDARNKVVAIAAGLLLAQAASAAQNVEGQVLGAGAPISGSTVTLWAASAGAPAQVATAQTGADGRFTMAVPDTPAGSSLYMIATGGTAKASKDPGANPAIALMTVLGERAPAKVTINEMTTVASVWTNAQFLGNAGLSGHALGLKIAAGNVPNFVNLGTGGWGDAIQSSLNGSQTPTMANFSTLADVLAGCVARVAADACARMFEAA